MSLQVGNYVENNFVRKKILLKIIQNWKHNFNALKVDFEQHISILAI